MTKQPQFSQSKPILINNTPYQSKK